MPQPLGEGGSKLLVGDTPASPVRPALSPKKGGWPPPEPPLCLFLCNTTGGHPSCSPGSTGSPQGALAAQRQECRRSDDRQHEDDTSSYHHRIFCLARVRPFQVVLPANVRTIELMAITTIRRMVSG